MKGLARDLGRLVAKERIKTDPEDLFAYGGDATYYVKRGKPDAVVLPENTNEVSELMKYAFHNAIPVTPRGAGSGLSGGCTPLRGGIVLDMKRMGRILEINRRNMSARVEAGVVLADIEQTGAETVLTQCPACRSHLRTQLKDGRVTHPIVVLAKAYGL